MLVIIIIKEKKQIQRNHNRRITQCCYRPQCYVIIHSQKLAQSAHDLKEETISQQKELACWKESCEKLTASVSRKEMEVMTLTQKLEQLVHQVCCSWNCYRVIVSFCLKSIT